MVSYSGIRERFVVRLVGRPEPASVVYAEVNAPINLLIWEQRMPVADTWQQNGSLHLPWAAHCLHGHCQGKLWTTMRYVWCWNIINVDSFRCLLRKSGVMYGRFYSCDFFTASIYTVKLFSEWKNISLRKCTFTSEITLNKSTFLPYVCFFCVKFND